ncbi:hypothetical protein KGM_204330 [Danaus plexippus plexippus]|uniref:Peptidase M14 domain-containing protein n=1 Tax=Danaus plexippus plexippus TaxID=278856 RepID=A0A212EKM8_DANPL|nr:hypothetical protein KGM_204330 [Danaus plexippus plexippus]
MNFGIFLIILGFAHLVCCSNSNVTNNECDVCTLSWFRRKRDLKEYTRWKSNVETTQEFIVKVLEDDVSLPQIKKFAAINIAPFTKEREKIIIGGPITPSPTTPSDSDKLKDYTRFGPPSTLSVTAIDGNIILQPIKINENAIAPIRPPGRKSGLEPAKNPLRDESPPARPQFLPKQEPLIARQFAPIAPVSFTKRNSLGPLTGRGIDKSMLFRETTFQHPTRTSHAELEVPKRTTEFTTSVTYDYNYELRSQFVPMRTSQKSIIDLHRTITDQIETENSDFMPTIASKKIAAQKGSSKIGHKETKMAYDLLYHDEDEISDPRRKEHQRITESYDDLHVIDNENVTRDDALNNAEERESTTDDSDSNNNDKDNLETTISGFQAEQKLFGVATIESVSNKWDSEEDEDKSKTTLKEKKVFLCNILKRRQLSFSTPLTLYEIVTQLKQWADESPVAKWMDLTEGNYTIMENPIHMMMVDDPSSGQIMSAKKTVMIVAGIQGRDHHAVTAAMYVLYQLIERSEAHSDLLTKFRFWIVPVFNPDGYDYSMTFPQRREWTKNVRQSWDSCQGRILCRTCEEFGVGCTIRPCYGVNLDRNFEYQWIPTEELRSEHPCGMLYAGPRQLSEAETIALTHFLHSQRTPIHTFIAFKEGDVLGIMYPYSHTKKRRAFDHIYRHRASRAAAAANSISGRPYVAGQTSEFLPLYAGGVEDWVDGHLGIDNTYTVMMFRPSDSYSSKLITERVVHEAYAAVDTLLLESVETPRSPQTVLTRAKASANTLFANIFILLPMVLGFG